MQLTVSGMSIDIIYNLDSNYFKIKTLKLYEIKFKNLIVYYNYVWFIMIVNCVYCLYVVFLLKELSLEIKKAVFLYPDYFQYICLANIL